jgi:hypothetical protein
MQPMYATANDVRRRLGAHLADVSDDIINQLILYYSNIARQITICPTTSRKWLYFARDWVVLQSGLSLLDNHPAFSGAHLPGISKTLGDFQISKTPPNTRTSLFGDLVERFQCDLYKLEPAVRDCVNPVPDCLGLKDVNARYLVPLLPQDIIRGQNDPNYPAIGRRWADSPLPIATDSLFVWSRWFKTRYSINGFLR